MIDYTTNAVYNVSNILPMVLQNELWYVVNVIYPFKHSSPIQALFTELISQIQKNIR